MHPVTTTAVVEGLKMELEPLKEVSEIIQVDGQPLKLLGFCRMFLESDNHRWKKYFTFWLHKKIVKTFLPNSNVIK